MYEIYTQEIKKELSENKEELNSTNESIKVLKQYFDNFQRSRELGYNYTEVLEGKGKVIKDARTPNEKYYNIQINNLNNLLKIKANKEEKKKKLKHILIPDNVFTFILWKFNKLLIDKIIYEAYTFSDLYLGDLFIVPLIQQSNKKSINWPLTKIAKKKLIDNGQIPYCQVDKDLADKEGKEYKGVEYLVRYDEPYTLLFRWSRTTKNFIRLVQSKEYVFKPSRGNLGNSAMELLTKYKNSFTKEEFENKFNIKIPC
jgi:hypothetical protein